MSAQPGQVARLTPMELVDLDGWNFTKDYQNHRNELVDLAKCVYTSLCIALSAAPSEVQFHRAFTGSLLCSDLYLIKIAHNKRHLLLSLYPHYADLLAKYVREHNWNMISNVPCPP